MSGVCFDGYEIHHGTTRADAGSDPLLREALPGNGGWQRGQTLALYPHGLFESARAMKSLFGRQTRTLNDTLEGLADFIDAHFSAATLMSLISGARR